MSQIKVLFRKVAKLRSEVVDQKYRGVFLRERHGVGKVPFRFNLPYIDINTFMANHPPKEGHSFKIFSQKPSDCSNQIMLIS